MEAGLRTVLARLARAHAALLHRAGRTHHESAEAVQNLGAALVFHDVVMQLLPEPYLNVVDEGVIEQLSSEQQSLSQNLEHLQSLCDSDPSSSDIETLAAALLERMRNHLDRSERAIYVPLKRFFPEPNEDDEASPRGSSR